MNGRSFRAIGRDNTVYRSDGVARWTYVGNGVSDIAASRDGSVIVVNDDGGALRRKVGDDALEALSMIPNGRTTTVAAPSSQRALAIVLRRQDRPLLNRDPPPPPRQGRRMPASPARETGRGEAFDRTNGAREDRGCGGTAISAAAKAQRHGRNG